MAVRDLTAARLRELLHYDPDTGVFAWIATSSNVAVAGSVAGGIDTSTGYVKVSVDKRTYYAHRLAWFYMYGTWPAGEIDHINGIRSDNRMANLRDVPRRINRQNQRSPLRGNKSGYLGVHWSKAANKWCASIMIDKKSRHLGLFESAEVAHAAYVKAKRELHPGGML